MGNKRILVTGCVGYAILDIINYFIKAICVIVLCIIKPRRASNINVHCCNLTKSKKEVGCVIENDIYAMCKDAFDWQSKNPNGYKDIKL